MKAIIGILIPSIHYKPSKDLLDCKVVLAMVCILKEVPRLAQEAQVETWKSVISILNLIPSTVMRHSELITVAPAYWQL